MIAWVQHALPRDPLHLFEAPIFYPEHDTLAYSEHMIVPAVIGLPFHWAGGSPVLVYNLLVMVGFVLSGVAMSRLMTRWTGSLAAGVVAGALFSFNAHVLTRFAHLQALHVEFIPLTLYALDRVLDEPRIRHAVLLSCAFVLQALCSNYLMVMLAFALASTVVVRSEPWRTPAACLAASRRCGAAAIVVLTPVLLPYYRLHETQGLTRTIDDVRLLLGMVARLHGHDGSAPLQPLVVSIRDGGRTALFPGFTALVLACVALASGRAWRDPRARMMLPIAVVGVLLSLGANLPGYGWLQEHVTVLQGVRAAHAGGISRSSPWRCLPALALPCCKRAGVSGSWWPAFVVALLGLVTVEAMRTPLLLVRFDGIASVHNRMNTDEVRAIVMYPLYQAARFT